MRFTRVLYKDNTVLNDWSTELDNYHSGSQAFTFVAADDAIYIGNIAPFNHFYINVGTTNTASSNMSIAYYSGRTFHPVAEIIDETNGLQQSGYVTFVPDKNQGWVEQDTSGSGGTITELNSVEIYDKYWIKITFSADLDASTSINWIKNLFSDDDELGSEYPDLTRSTVLTAFELGKTSWEEQHVRAAEIIIDDLIRKKIIYTKNQILERRTFKLAAVSKVAELVFNSFGDDYIDNKRQAQQEYEKRLNKSIFDIDQNDDGRLNPREQGARQGFMIR